MAAEERDTRPTAAQIVFLVRLGAMDTPTTREQAYRMIDDLLDAKAQREERALVAAVRGKGV